SRFSIDLGAVEWNLATASQTQVNAPTIDTTPPSEITRLSATAGANVLTLTWTNPLTGDFNHVRILRDGVYIANNVVGQNYVDSSLTSSKQYVYTLKTVDNFDN